MSADEPKSYLVVKVLEASGHNSNEVKVWDDDFKEGYVRVEIRGGSRTIKKQTALHKVRDNLIAWEEQLLMEVLEGASELRIMLCRQKLPGETRTGSSIVAACGIYVRDIHEAQPIDKYFELYKPGTGAEGGFIRVSMNELAPDQVRSGNGLLLGEKPKKKKKGGFPLIPLGILAAGGLVAFNLLKKK